MNSYQLGKERARQKAIEWQHNYADRPHIVGYATIADAYFCPVSEFNRFRDLTLIPPGSAYDCHGKGKWFYEMVDAEPCEPFPLPEDATYHGRSWCEYGERTEYVTWTTRASFCKP